MNEVQKHFSESRWTTEDEKSLKLILSREKEPHFAFPNEVWEMLSINSNEFNGKKILVPSSGNNFAVFAFSLLGASVTSTDFMQNVLDEAKTRANEHGLSNIEFKNVDTMSLEGLPENEYDFIFTSNGVYHSIHDIQSMHKAFFRVLKPNGVYCFYDNHPFFGMFSDELDPKGVWECTGTLEVTTKPNPYDTLIEQGKISNFSTVEDLIHSLLDANFVIIDYRDICRKFDVIPNLSYRIRKKSVRMKLPAWIGISAKKN